MEPEALDHPGALARLTAMIGRRVEVTVRGVGKQAADPLKISRAFSSRPIRSRTPRRSAGTPKPYGWE